MRCAAYGRFCCKSLFALLIKNSPGCRRDFRVTMWGTSSPDDKLTGDLGSVIETTQIGGRRSDRLMAGKLSPGNFGLLQQYRHKADLARRLIFVRFRGQNGHQPAMPDTHLVLNFSDPAPPSPRGVLT